MKYLALSGSTRTASRTTAFLRACAAITPPPDMLHVFSDLASLPVYSPDMASAATPQSVLSFYHLVSKADGLIISSPAYVTGVPGGLMNAVDWLVAGHEIASKPVAILHAFDGGEMMLKSLAETLKAASDQFTDTVFERFHMQDVPLDDITDVMQEDDNKRQFAHFIEAFRQHILA